MKCKCPACGALNSLDSLVANEKASEALHLALSFNGDLGKALIGYMGLFRPAEKALSFDRVAKLLNELLPLIQQSEFKRNHQVYAATVDVWIDGINQVLANRHQLRLPLNGHGYLLEIMVNLSLKSAVRNQGALVQSGSNTAGFGSKQSKTATTLEEIGAWVTQNG